MKPRIARVGLLTLLFLPAACGRREQAVAPSPAGIRRYALKGVVQSVDSSRANITVSHEAVPGYMGAMTMSFPIKEDPQVIAILRPGDKIEATLVVDRDSYWLEKILTKGFVPTPAPAASAVVTPEPNRAIGVGDIVPDFALTDQSGRATRLSKFRGQPLAITFIYTRCPIATACPMTTAKFSKLDSMLAQKGFGHLLTLTLDPEHDTPGVLADYAKKAGADSRRWTFLTGDPRAVADVASRFGILYYPEHGQIIHTQAVAVIDPRGRLSAISYGNDWQPENVLKDLEKARTDG